MDATTGAAGPEDDEDAAGEYAWYACDVCAGVMIIDVECESDGCCEPEPRADGYADGVRSNGGGVRERGGLAQCPLGGRCVGLEDDEDARCGAKGKSCRVGPVREGRVGQRR